MYGVLFFTQETTVASLMPVCLELAGDPVPNVRFNVAKTFQSICSVIPVETIEKEVVPLLRGLTSDNDPDVRYFAQEALQQAIETKDPPSPASKRYHKNLQDMAIENTRDHVRS